LQEHIKQLVGRGAKRKAEMTPEELGAANPPTEKKNAAAKTASGDAKSKSPPLGAAHFLKLTNRGEPEWSLLAVEAPLDQVTEALSQRHKSTVQPTVEIKKSRKNDELARNIAIVQVKENSWTVILRSLFYVDRSNVTASEDDAKALSEKLKTKA